MSERIATWGRRTVSMVRRRPLLLSGLFLGLVLLLALANHVQTLREQQKRLATALLDGRVSALESRISQRRLTLTVMLPESAPSDDPASLYMLLERIRARYPQVRELHRLNDAGVSQAVVCVPGDLRCGVYPVPSGRALADGMQVSRMGDDAVLDLLIPEADGGWLVRGPLIDVLDGLVGGDDYRLVLDIDGGGRGILMTADLAPGFTPLLREIPLARVSSAVGELRLYPRVAGGLPLNLRGIAYEALILLLAVLGFAAIAVTAWRAARRQQERTELSLADTERRLSRLLDTAQEGVLTVDAEGRVTYANRRAAKLLGFDAGAMRGHPFTDFAHPDDIDRVRQQFRRRRRGLSDQYELRLATAEPDRRLHVLIASSPVLDSRGRFQGAILMFSDISAHLLAQEALKASEARFRDFASIAADWFWETDAQLRFTFVSERHEQINGLSSSQVLGEHRTELLERYCTLPQERWEAHLKDIEARRPFAGLELYWRRPDGEERLLASSGKPVFDSDGQFRGYRGCARDVTARQRAEAQLKQAYDELEDRVRQRTEALVRANDSLQHEIRARRGAEQALRESEERFRQLAEHVDEVFWMVGRGGDERIYVSPAFEAVWGRPRAFWYQESWLDTVHPEDRTRVRSGLTASRYTGRLDQEYRVLRPDGGIRWIHDRGFPVRDRDGNVYRMAGLAADITQRRAALEQLRSLQAELAHMGRVTLAGEMASGLAHEINQPLAAMVTYNQAAMRLLKRAPTDLDGLRAALEKAAQQGLRAGEILHRLRNFIRKRTPQRELLSLDAVIRDVEELCRTECRRHEVRLDLALTSDLPAVPMDAVQIQQVVLNLVRNAAEAMREQPVELRQLLITTRRVDHGLEVAVIDSGPGLSPEAISNLFHPFFSTKEQGMGLGLSISRSIVEAHGGELVVEAEAEGGTAFRFVLPLVEQAVPEHTDGQSAD